MMNRATCVETEKREKRWGVIVVTDRAVIIVTNEVIRVETNQMVITVMIIRQPSSKRI